MSRTKLKAVQRDLDIDWGHNKEIKQYISRCLDVEPMNTVLADPVHRYVSLQGILGIIAAAAPGDMELAKKLVDQQISEWIKTAAVHVMLNNAQAEKGDLVILTNQDAIATDAQNATVGKMSVPVNQSGGLALPAVPWDTN